MIRLLSVFVCLLSLSTLLTAETPLSATSGKVAHLKVEGEINDHQVSYLKDRLEQAKRLGVNTLVVEIDSLGGRVDSAIEMYQQILRQDAEKIRTIAFVDKDAISAAALLAYSHEEIYVTREGKIGDVGEIFQDENGKFQYAPEKIHTYMRTIFTEITERRPWPKALFMKMTDLEYAIYEVNHPNGRIEYVSGHDLDIFLRDNPEIAKEKDKRMTIIFKEKKLLTLTGTQAVKFKMATDLVPNLAAVYARLNVSQAQVIELAPTGQELLARKLAAIAPLLLGLAVLFLILELKSPGFGLFITLSGICFAAFFAFQYWLHLASHVEVIILVLALVAIAVDLWFGLTGGILAACGAALFLMGTVLLFMPQDISFGDSSRLFRLLGGALVQSLVACSIIVIGIAILIAALPKLPWIKRVSAMTDLPTGDSLKPAMQGEGLIGTVAVVEAELRPAGSVQIAGHSRSAVSQHGEFLPVGTKVRVEGANFGDLVVRPLRADETVTPGGS